MAQVSHGSAATTHASEKQYSDRKLRSRRGAGSWELGAGSWDQNWAKGPSSNYHDEDSKGVVVTFRCDALLPLDDHLYALQPSIAHLTH